MSSDDREVMISVRGLSKAYTISHVKDRSTTLAEAIVRGIRTPFQQRPKNETFWALKDVNFDVRRGEVLGVIGRNGAGKSTLFKVLSRITEPTDGNIDLYGRVGSLLEVGTGFSGELTGRENIYLNGTILGMRRSEIARHFDEIIDFAGVEKFLDTPVKRYSSGMYVRLAFAVAAHLSSEILIIDEVLAVGDSAFQEKCLAKIKDVANSGRTCLFVSHNMAVVRSLCDSAIYMKTGQVDFIGNVNDAIGRYSHSGDAVSGIVYGNDGIALLKAEWQDIASKEVTRALIFGRSYRLSLFFRPSRDRVHAGIVVEIFDATGTKITSMNGVEEGLGFLDVSHVEQYIYSLPRLGLMPGEYSMSIKLYAQGTQILNAEHFTRFRVEPSMINKAAWAYRHDHGAARICRSVKVVVAQSQSKS